MTLKVIKNGRELTPREDYTVELYERRPVPRPWWKRLLARWVPAFREQYQFVNSPHVVLMTPPEEADTVVVMYEVEG